MNILYALYALICLAALFGLFCCAQAALHLASARWYGGNIAVLDEHGLGEVYERRKASPPWYVRYTQWLERVFPSRES